MEEATNNRSILITGVNGQIGFELMRSLQGLGKIVAVDRQACDLADLAQVRELVRAVKPAIIVNPAAYTAVDRAESEMANAARINAEAPGVLAEETKRLGALLVHYSTDYVFDGGKSEPYAEDDPAHPQNVYGQTKLAGEQAIRAAGCAHLIFRTSWVYGRRGKNFLLTMLKLATERAELKIVSDQIGAPTWSRTVAALTAQVIAQGMQQPAADWWFERSGIYHLTAAGSTSWAGFAEAIFELAKLPSRPLVRPIATADYSTPAKRPVNSRLSNEKLARVFGLCGLDWRDALQLCLSN